MRLHPMSELHKLKPDNWTISLFNQAIRLQKIPFIWKWMHINHLEFSCAEYAKTLGWEPDTTLVVYVPPPDKDKDYSNEIEGELSKLNTTQCMCVFIENSTLEQFVKDINQVIKMKAFL